MFTHRCDTAHGTDYTVEGAHPATIDLGKYRKLPAFSRPVRYLCADCARGLYFPAKYRIPTDRSSM